MYVSKVILTNVILGTSYLRVREHPSSEKAVQHHPLPSVLDTGMLDFGSPVARY